MSLTDFVKGVFSNKKPADSEANGSSEEIHFVSVCGKCEEKLVKWNIGNVQDFLQMDIDLPQHGIQFQAGRSVGNSASWYLYFQHSQDTPGYVGIYLGFKGAEGLKPVNARYSITLSSGCQAILVLHARSIKKFGEKGPECSGWNAVITKASLLEKTETTNRLEVILQLKVYPDVVFQPSVQQIPGSGHNGSLSKDRVISDFEQLLESEDGADLVIKIPSENYSAKAHKVILMARSPVFARMLAADTKMVEGNTGEVVLTDMSSTGLDVLLKYIYTGKVSQNWVNVPEEIINAAEKYSLPQLKHFCGHNLMQAVNIKNAKRLYALAKLLNLSFAAYGIKEFISRNAEEFLNASELSDIDKDEGEDDEEEEAEE